MSRSTLIRFFTYLRKCLSRISILWLMQRGNSYDGFLFEVSFWESLHGLLIWRSLLILGSPKKRLGLYSILDKLSIYFCVRLLTCIQRKEDNILTVFYGYSALLSHSIYCYPAWRVFNFYNILCSSLLPHFLC